ncbi:MAG: phosphoglycerate kinase, partial [Candidatus Eisenbacteria bacterium]|nr:phosphoglycerate kinase [Candidatus Eisenbacteria bacterium]
MDKMTVDDLDVSGKRVLVRVDFNVPIEDGRIADDTRIRASLPTIQRLRQGGARAILMSHLGRPKKGPDPALSLRPVAARLAELLGSPVAFAEDCVGEPAEKAAASLAPGGVLLFENLRFHPEEEKNHPDFARRLASLGVVYVDDAFGSAHRAHASTEGVTHYLSPCVAGELMQKELEFLGAAVESPKRPFVAVLGGAKISGKIDVIENLLPKVDALLIGGAMMFTFLDSRDVEVGRSLVEADRIEMARGILDRAEKAGLQLILPLDCRVAASTDGTDPGRVVLIEEIPADAVGVDIGPATVEAFDSWIENAGTVLWNGPMGIFEKAPYAEGTLAIARALASATRKGATTIVGGGDSAAAVAQAGLTGSCLLYTS